MSLTLCTLSCFCHRHFLILAYCHCISPLMRPCNSERVRVTSNWLGPALSCRGHATSHSAALNTDCRTRESTPRRANQATFDPGTASVLCSVSAYCICSTVPMGGSPRARVDLGVRRQLPGKIFFESVTTSWQETPMASHFLCSAAEQHPPQGAT